MKKKKQKERYFSEKKKSGQSSVPLEPKEPDILIQQEQRPNSRNKAQHLRTQDIQRQPTVTKGLKPNSTKISRLLSGQVFGQDKNPTKIMADNTGLDLDVPEITVLDTSGVNLNKDLDYIGSSTLKQHKSTGKYLGNTDSKNELRRRLFGKGNNKILQGFPEDKEYLKTGTQINEQTLYTGNVSVYEQPDAIFDQDDYQKRIRFDRLKNARLEAMCNWKQSDVKGMKKGAYIKDIQAQNDQILQVIDKNDLEKIEVYTDRYPLLKIRKHIQKFGIFISISCNKIITQQWFDNISILVIMVNCFVMIKDPGDECTGSGTEQSIFCIAEKVFTYLYIIEMVLKIAGMGFIMKSDSYLRDGWNQLDFVIVMSSILEIILAATQETKKDDDLLQPPGLNDDGGQGTNLKSLRVVRVARPLKTISSIKGLKVIIIAVLSALPLLKDTLLVLAFFFVVFGILGQQLFGGILKNRCLNIQTGSVHPQNILCSQMFQKKGESSCPSGYVCSKTDENPNYGVTNFDNLTYSMLAIFQCITLEGWSDIQRDIQTAFHQVMYLFFIPMVVFGAFFLLNLTLAVINSKFTEAHNLQQEKDRIELTAANEAKIIELNNEGINIALLNDEISVQQFINARIYAKKMIEFLRMRQEIKRIEAEQILNTRIKVQTQQKLRRSSIMMVEGAGGRTSLQKSKSALLKKEFEILNEKPKVKEKQCCDHNPKKSLDKSDSSEIFENLERRALENKSAVIKEESDDESKSQEEKDELEKEVQEFLLKSQIDMKRNGIYPKDLSKLIKQNTQLDQSLKKHSLNRNSPLTNTKLDNSEEGGPKLMGNLSITKLNINKETFQKMADDLDIDNIIKKEDQILQPSVEDGDQIQDRASIQSFEVGSMKSQVSFFQMDQGHKDEPLVRDLENIPGIDLNNLKIESQSGLISSDSDFDLQEAQLEANKTQKSNRFIPNEKKTSQTNEIGRDVSKTFKRMLTSNHNRDYNNHNSLNLTPAEIELIQSTRFGQSSGPRLAFMNEQTQISVADSKEVPQNAFEIERKYNRKKKTVAIHKSYKENEYLENLTKVQTQFKQDSIGEDFKFNFKTPGNELQKLEEFVNQKQPRNVFQDIDPLFKKVEISHGTIYNSSSQNDVFHPRQVTKEKMQMIDENKYLQLQKKKNEAPEMDLQSKTYIRKIHEPYQIKNFYKIQEDSSDLLTESSENEDDLAAEEQPYMTACRIGYKHQTKQLYTKEMCKRSDIMITSTISMSLFPKDQRMIEQHMRVYMDELQMIDFVDEKNAFQSMIKEHGFQVQRQREKDKEYRDTYARSMIFKADFTSPSLLKFQKNVTDLNRNKKQKIKKHKQEIDNEKIKHKQLLQASFKRGYPLFDKDNVGQLLEGKFHDDEDDEIVKGGIVHAVNKTMKVQKEEFERDNRMQQFNEDIQEICDRADDYDQRLNMVDEVPYKVRQEFNIPRDLGKNQINFLQIRTQDAQKKKTHQIWSGQDVLPDSLDVVKSQSIIDNMNTHRVWPMGAAGLYKRFKYVVRLHAKSEAYDNFFTLFVLLSTMAMCAEKYGNSKETTDLLELFDLILTWTFIYEMVMKQFAIGINKYLADSMNWLDGFIVLTSVVELAFVGEKSWAGYIKGEFDDIQARKQAKILAEQGLAIDGEDVAFHQEESSPIQINLSALRVLRTLRVLRMVRLLRALKSMQVILGVVVSSYKSFMYITILMVLFIFILSLLGLQLFKGKFDDDPLGIPENNFETFGPSFFTMFQILTMENWQTILFVTLRNQKDAFQDIYLPVILFIAWIFVGNFILLNLFLAILLDAFLEEDEVELDEIEIAVIKAKKKAKKLEKKRKKEANMIMMDVNLIKKHKRVQGSLVNLGEENDHSMEELEDMDSQQIEQIFKDMGLIQKEKSEIKEEKLFDNVECEYSFYAFSQENMIRIWCYRATKHPLWETIVFILIGLSSFKLVTDSYAKKWDNDKVNDVSDKLDYVFNFAFLIEMLIKLVSIGLIMDDGSYLRDEWNTLDFFIVCSSVVDMAMTNVEVPIVKVMRILRALRPLRFITHNVAMRLLVNALIKSLGGIFNVLFVVLVVYLLFAILAGSFYRGKFFYCSIDPYILHYRPQCEIAGGKWLIFDHNFDDAIKGTITMFIVASLEGWPDIFVQAWQVQSKQNPELRAHGPTLDGNGFILALVFFFCFIFIGSFFFLNFFTGVLFMKFNQAQQSENRGFTNKDLGWMDIQKMILQSSPDYETTNVPTSTWRRKFHRLVIAEKFENFIMICIILNMIQMMVYIDDIKNQSNYENVLAVFNGIFSAIFFIEAVLKLIAFGTSYFQSNWNVFDFSVVLSSIIDLLSSSPMLNDIGDSAFINQLSKNAKLLRIARVARILRLAGKAKGLQAILQTIFFSLPALGNVAVLLSLIYFMLAIVANFLFQDIIDGDVLDGEQKNFSNFMNSLVLLFALSTGEDWNKVMFDCSRSDKDGCTPGMTCAQYPKFSFVFFIFMIIVCSYVMLNLFVLVIIQQFEKYYLSEDENILSKFQTDLSAFKQVWKELTLDKYQCQKIKEKHLMNFFRALGELSTTLGFPEETISEGELKKALLKMAIKGDNGYIYFNELLYRCMRRKYGTMKINKQMQIYELKTQYNIFLITLTAQKGNKGKPGQQDLIDNLVKKENGINPFLTIMNFKISFKTWLKFARKELDEIVRIDSGLEDKCNHPDMKIGVEIDIEHFEEYTSDEEVYFSQDGRSIEQGSASGSESYTGLSRKMTLKQKASIRSTKNNHIEILKKKMTEKIKTRQQEVEQKINLQNQKNLISNSTMIPHEHAVKHSQLYDGKNRRKSVKHSNYNSNESKVESALSKSQSQEKVRLKLFGDSNQQPYK